MRNGDCWTFVSAVCFTGELITLNELEDAQLYPLIFTIILVRLLKKLENILHILNSAADSSNFKQNKIGKITEVRMLAGHRVIQVLLESRTNVFSTVPTTIPAHAHGYEEGAQAAGK